MLSVLDMPGIRVINADDQAVKVVLELYSVSLSSALSLVKWLLSGQAITEPVNYLCRHCIVSLQFF